MPQQHFNLIVCEPCRTHNYCFCHAHSSESNSKLKGERLVWRIWLALYGVCWHLPKVSSSALGCKQLTENTLFTRGSSHCFFPLVSVDCPRIRRTWLCVFQVCKSFQNAVLSCLEGILHGHNYRLYSRCIFINLDLAHLPPGGSINRTKSCFTGFSDSAVCCLVLFGHLIYSSLALVILCSWVFNLPGVAGVSCPTRSCRPSWAQRNTRMLYQL